MLLLLIFLIFSTEAIQKCTLESIIANPFATKKSFVDIGAYCFEKCDNENWREEIEQWLKDQKTNDGAYDLSTLQRRFNKKFANAEAVQTPFGIDLNGANSSNNTYSTCRTDEAYRPGRLKIGEQITQQIAEKLKAGEFVELTAIVANKPTKIKFKAMNEKQIPQVGQYITVTNVNSGDGFDAIIEEKGYKTRKELKAGESVTVVENGEFCRKMLKEGEVIRLTVIENDNIIEKNIQIGKNGNDKVFLLEGRGLIKTRIGCGNFKVTVPAGRWSMQSVYSVLRHALLYVFSNEELQKLKLEKAIKMRETYLSKLIAMCLTNDAKIAEQYSEKLACMDKCSQTRWLSEKLTEIQAKSDAGICAAKNNAKTLAGKIFDFGIAQFTKQIQQYMQNESMETIYQAVKYCHIAPFLGTGCVANKENKHFHLLALFLNWCAYVGLYYNVEHIKSEYYATEIAQRKLELNEEMKKMQIAEQNKMKQQKVQQYTEINLIEIAKLNLVENILVKNVIKNQKMLERMGCVDSKLTMLDMSSKYGDRFNMIKMYCNVHNWAMKMKNICIVICEYKIVNENYCKIAKLAQNNKREKINNKKQKNKTGSNFMARALSIINKIAISAKSVCVVVVMVCWLLV